MADPQVLSGSSLNTFLRCARQWEFAYVQRVKSPPTLKLALGSAAHTAVEKDLTHKLQTEEDLSKDEIQTIFRDEFVKEAQDAVEGKGETKGSMTDSGVQAVGFWRDEVAPRTKPALVEQPVKFKINGTDITGTIDIVHDDDRVGDWKFTGRSPQSGKSYVLNMVGYALGFRHLTGRMEKSILLDHIVRTKTPKHVPIESEGPVPDRSIQAYARIVGDVARQIDAGLFPPTGLQSNACSWCGYKDICSAYQASR